MSSITFLGTGTCQIEHERRASSVLLELDGLPILFDCGHGVLQRLFEVGVRHDRLSHVILSHFHPDHVSDLIPLMHAGAWSRRDPRSTDLHIYGPPGAQRLIDGLMDVFGAESFSQLPYQVRVHEITEASFSIEKYIFDFIDLPLSSNHGLRFTWNGKRYAITGDSHFHEQEIDFLRGVDLAIIDSGHPQDEEIVQLAAQSQAQVIVCSHQYRDLDIARLLLQAKEAGYGGTMIAGRDLMSFVL
jgi:ribonuclease BN (tRNA processing enzyme)